MYIMHSRAQAHADGLVREAALLLRAALEPYAPTEAGSAGEWRAGGIIRFEIGVLLLRIVVLVLLVVLLVLLHLLVVVIASSISGSTRG